MQTKHSSGPNFWEVAARKKLRAKEDWKMYRWERVNMHPDSDVIVTGAVPIGHYTRGPRKGRPKWDVKLGERVVVTDADFCAARHEYETASGNCHDCFGTGQKWCGWTSGSGSRYEPCRRCGASGAAP